MDDFKKDCDISVVSLVDKECDFPEIFNFPLLDYPYVFPVYSDNN